MAIQGINSLQVSAAKSWAGLTTDSHLYSIGQREPQMASDIVTQIWNMQGQYSFDSFLSKYPTVYYDTDADYRWFLKGDDEKAVTITGYTATDSTRPGVGKSIFQLKLAERYFVVSDFLTFDDKQYGVLIVGEGFVDGTDWVYEVQHMNPSDSFFIPPVFLTAGVRKVSKQNNAVTNTLNKRYGETQFSSHFEMRNAFSTMSKKYTVAGNIAGKNGPMIISMLGPDGEKVTTWARWQDLVFQKQWMQEKSRRLMFDQSNQNSDGTYSQKDSSGFVIKQGSGLREQISPSHKFFYSTLTLDYIYEVCLNLSINILSEDRREFLILTGERGMIKFHKLIEANVALNQPMGNPARLFGSGQNLGFGGQYLSFKGPQGINIHVMKMAEYDDPTHNRLEHPEGGTAESYRMTIMNIGTTEGNPNIQKVAVRGRENITWHVDGSTSPFGPMNGGPSASHVDGYEWFAQGTQSVMLRNPLSVAELIPNFVVV